MYTKDEVLTELREEVNDIWMTGLSKNRRMFQYSMGYPQILSCIHLQDNLDDGLQKHSVLPGLPDSLPNELDELNFKTLKSITDSFHAQIQHKLIQSILTELLEHSPVITRKLDVDFIRELENKSSCLVSRNEFIPKYDRVYTRYRSRSIMKINPFNHYHMVVPWNDFPAIGQNTILLFDQSKTVELRMKKIPTSFDMTKDLYEIINEDLLPVYLDYKISYEDCQVIRFQ